MLHLGRMIMIAFDSFWLHPSLSSSQELRSACFFSKIFRVVPQLLLTLVKFINLREDPEIGSVFDGSITTTKELFLEVKLLLD